MFDLSIANPSAATSPALLQKFQHALYQHNVECEGSTILCRAAGQGCVSLMETLLDKYHADVNAVHQGSTPLIKTRSHLRFLQEWLTVRRQCQDISHTPMGYVCQGWKLRGDHPFFLTWETSGQTMGTVLGRSTHNSSEYNEGVYYDSDEGEDVGDLEDGDVLGDESEVE